MEHVKALLSLEGKDVSNTAACSQDLTADSTRLAGDRAEWMKHRRRLCLPLAKQVASVLKAMSGGAFVVRRGVILEHATGTLNPLIWVDCLAVSPFGAFVIDRYDWMGAVKRSMNDDELLVHENFGVVSVQTSPLRRAKPALRHLRSILGEYNCPVECIAVFAASYCALDPTLPEAMLQGAELHHFMRTRLNRFRDSHSRYLDPEMIATHLQLRCADWGKG